MIDNLKKRQEDIQEDYEYTKKKVDEAKQEHKDIKDRIIEVKNNIELNKEDHKRNILKLEYKNKEDIKIFTMQISSMESTIGKSKEMIDKISKELNTMAQERDFTIKKNRNITKRNAEEIEEIHQQLTDRMNALQNELENTYVRREGFDQIKDENQKLQQDNVRLIEKISELKNENNKIKREGKNAIDDRELIEMEEKYEVLMGELKKLRIENLEYSEGRKAQVQRIRDTEDEIKQLEEKNKKSKTKKRSLKKKIDQLKKQIRDLELEREMNYHAGKENDTCQIEVYHLIKQDLEEFSTKSRRIYE